MHTDSGGVAGQNDAYAGGVKVKPVNAKVMTSLSEKIRVDRCIFLKYTS